jgi:outer membrane protein assembly factor BamA
MFDRAYLRFCSLFACLITLLLAGDASAYGQAPDSTRIRKNFRAIGLPIAFYSPDTRFGAGGLAMFTFSFKGDTSQLKRSNFQVGAAYTTMRQVLLYTPYQLFLRRRALILQGELGYYRYVYNFFGVGNGMDPDYLERYDANYPRVRINALHKVRPGLYLGLNYGFDDFQIVRRDPGGILAADSLIGSQGGRISSLGLGFFYDSRDNNSFPTRGYLVEGEARTDQRWTGSQFQYSRLHVSASRYWPLLRTSVIAVNAAATFTMGDAPFFQLATLGGTKRLRGYFEGKYRDRHAFLLQTEYRSPMWWRIGGVAFGGVGAVSDGRNALLASHLRFNYGAGLRVALDRVQRINLRIDYGRGYQSSGFYLTIGEAF